jgi:SAM-dependent methyltransferase
MPPPYTLIDGIKCYSPEVATAYDDYPDAGFDVTDRNVEKSFWVRSRNRLFTRLVRKYKRPSGRTRFLEIGCGTGDFIQQLAGEPDLDITGSEIYLGGLRYARKNLPSVEFVQFDVSRGTMGEGFDMICAFDVLEHIENDTAALANMHRMLAPGGVLLLSVPQHMFLWSQLDEIVKHKRRYSRSDLAAKFAAAGFDVEYATSFVFTLFPPMLLSRLLDRKRQAATPAAADADLEKRVKFSGAVNGVFDAFMRVDEALIRMGASLPVGGTLVMVARKG